MFGSWVVCHSAVFSRTRVWVCVRRRQKERGREDWAVGGDREAEKGEKERERREATQRSELGERKGRRERDGSISRAPAEGLRGTQAFP